MGASHATTRPTRVFVGLGSNIGDRRAHIESALNWLEAHPAINLVRRTTIVETAPWGVEEQPWFLNAVAEIRTQLEPDELLAELKHAERLLGRSGDKYRRWGPREIDLDILLFGDRVISSENLAVPHPRLTERAFVLDQLLVLEPTIKHPITGDLMTTFMDKLEKNKVAPNGESR